MNEVMTKEVTKEAMKEAMMEGRQCTYGVTFLRASRQKYTLNSEL